MERILLIVSIAANLALFFIVIAMSKAIINIARHRTNRLKLATDKLTRIVNTHSFRMERVKTEFKIPRYECEHLFRYAYLHHPYGNLVFQELPEWIQDLVIRKYGKAIAKHLKENIEMIQAKVAISQEHYDLTLYTEIHYCLMSPPDHLRFSISNLRDQFPTI